MASAARKLWPFASADNARQARSTQSYISQSRQGDGFDFSLIRGSSESNSSNRRTLTCFKVVALLLTLCLTALSVWVIVEHIVPRHDDDDTPTGGTKITVNNKCEYEVWVGTIGTGPDSQPYNPGNGGFKLNPKDSKDLFVPKPWTSGRIWGRTGCEESGDGLNCESGDCDGKKQCVVSGEPPSTLVEMTLQEADQGGDYYDLSLVDGYSMPVEVVAIDGVQVEGTKPQFNCEKASCANFDFNLCPPELMVEGKDGLTYCGSICFAVHHRDRVKNADIIKGYNVDQVCCSCGPNCGGSCGCYTSAECLFGCSPYAMPGKGGVCKIKEWPLASNGLEYDKIFKNQCKEAYSWQFDDKDSTYRCVNASYEINFCP
ncbi:hypothetical protein CYMTET_15975 [Cymbomonas tetramitiformis]|uniref:Thaumatin-like protein n=1 Tax=Cymbomonas tetramitiformis TaxID=36881 RepID=A0AAE0GD15_9CHLO|nr:hypothetical protein CYMTET_15975 [Cymbomonas tetramitiformis]